MTSEQLAAAVGSSRAMLRRRLHDARSCLIRELKPKFRNGKVDFHNKRLVSECGRYALQWRLRREPDKPESYENQQTNIGSVSFVVL